jgi:hypothetical protein
MRRNYNLHTVMIIPRDRTREMSEFRVLEFAEIERTIEKKGMEHVQAPISDD